MGSVQENVESHALILQKLDDLKDAVHEQKQDIKDIRDDLVELKTNHLAHLSADIFILKDCFKTHQQGHTTTSKSQWKVWVAFITGACGILAAAMASLVK